MSHFSNYPKEGKGAGKVQAVSSGFIRESAGSHGSSTSSLGHISSEAGSAQNKVPQVWMTKGNNGISDKSQWELWVRVHGPPMMELSTSPPHLQQTTQAISQAAAGTTSPTWEWEKGVNYRWELKWPLPVPVWGTANVPEYTTCIEQHLKCSTFSTLWIRNGPLPPTPYTAMRIVSQANVCLSASGMDGIRQMLHKVFISPRRLRARRINLPLLGPLPQASEETVNWAWQGR